MNKKQKKPLKRKCRVCKEPARYITACNKAYCSAECGSTVALEILAKRREQEAKAFRSETRRRKLELNKQKPNWWIAIIQKKYFNPWIRLRDLDLPCISCGKYDYPGVQWDAGHYRSVGAAPELRFEPLNCHKQCRECNRGGEQWSATKITVGKNYEKNLIERIGQDKVDWLNGPHEPVRYRVDELKKLCEFWKRELKEMKEKVNHET